MTTSLDDQDCYAWANQQAARLRTGRLTEADNPSLRTQLDKEMRDPYRLSRIEAERKTGLTRGTFPADCPCTYEQVMNPEFWPE